jgi:hypothetical protein
MNKMTVFFRTLTLAGLLGGAVGLGASCEPDFTAGRAVLPDMLSTPDKWSIRSTGGGFHFLDLAIDNNAVTFAESSRQYQNAALTIDLGRRCVFNMIAIRHGVKEFGFARTLLCSTSTDGVTFTEQIRAYGTRKVTYISLMKPATARYVRLTVIEPGQEPWAIAEIFLQ